MFSSYNVKIKVEHPVCIAKNDLQVTEMTVPKHRLFKEIAAF